MNNSSTETILRYGVNQGNICCLVWKSLGICHGARGTAAAVLLGISLRPIRWGQWRDSKGLNWVMAMPEAVPGAMHRALLLVYMDTGAMLRVLLMVYTDTGAMVRAMVRVPPISF